MFLIIFDKSWFFYSTFPTEKNIIYFSIIFSANSINSFLCMFLTINLIHSNKSMFKFYKDNINKSVK